MLVVVLGLLVALFVIGTSFSFVTLSERRAAANYLDRQRALDLALDGVEYSIARLRAEAITKHYEGIGPSVAGLDDAGTEYDPRRYSLQPLDGADPAVSWNRAASKTSAANTGDGNWVDFNGDNNRGGDETNYGTDKNQPNFARTVTGFHADGINVNQVPNKDVGRAGENPYGPAGTYEPLGDYFRVRVVDAASLLNINNFRDKRLEQVLLTLGKAIDSWLNRGKPTPDGRDNPLPAEVVQEFVRVGEENGWIFSSKEQLRPIWQGFENGERMYELAMNFITVNSWVDNKYRDYCDANNEVDDDASANPLKLTAVELNREGFTRTDSEGRDGWPDWQPSATGFSKAPININTAPKPVLVCLFANLEAKARLLFFQKHDQITDTNKLIKDKFSADVPTQISGTPDLGRQNNRTVKDETNWYPSGEDNRAIFQLVPIGPITTAGSGGRTSSSAGGEDLASALADEVMRVRASAPFTSWQDFDARFCRGILLGLADSDRSNVRTPDLIGVPRSGSDLSRPNPQNIEGGFPKKLLPDPANCLHAANPIKSGDSAMTPSDFRAWYWKSCVDMIRAALSPVNLTARYNVDYPLHMNVDRMDLVTTSSPICFSSMGVYEIVSQGEIMAPEAGSENATSSGPAELRLPVARRQVRTVVQIYEVMRHASQRDWVTAPSSADFVRRATSSAPTKPEPLTALTKNETKSGPFSIDELDMGVWEKNSGPQGDYLAQLDDGKAIAYQKAKPGEPSPAKDRVKGHNPPNAASGDFGYVFMNPRDETPFTDIQENQYPLAFHARFNESLRARSKTTQFPNVKVEGVNSDALARDEAWGHLPWETGAAFDDFISTATPRSTEKALAVGGGGLANEFDNADSGDQATKYSTLMPDGAFLSGMKIRPRSERSLKTSFGVRGLARVPRLKLLRYPCGAQDSDNPFQPIRPFSWQGHADKDDGVEDAKQAGYVDPISGGEDDLKMRERMIGLAPPYRGSDQHNRDAEFNRQHRSNMPYYEGTVDFWIKWDLPPQGANYTGADVVVALGEIDPASHNFSALFGATAYGRFRDSAQVKAPDSTNRNANADFEGVQFFVYKEPGGILRFTRLYFSEAFGAAITGGGATGSTSTTVEPFGVAMRRIFDVTKPLGGYTGTNDICNDRGPYGNSNKGFLYARTDAWLDLSKASYVVGAGTGNIMLRPHDWHRFTLTYNSNTESPYRLWLDGRQVQAVEFHKDDDINAPKGYRNDGRHAPLTDQPLPTEEPTGSPGYDVYRTTSMLLEINPEDRLTVGCIFRRQLDIEDSGIFTTYYSEADDQGELVKPARPVFKFDSNIVAVANATIDDFRISAEVLGANIEITDAQFRPYSRYDADGNDCYYENGFLPIQGDDNMLHALPVRLGTISWTELRPDWDPYRGRGLTLATSSGIELEWAIVDDYATAKVGGEKTDISGAKYRGNSGRREATDVKSDEYWASGGMSMRGALLPSGNKVGLLMYRVHFRVGKEIVVNNVTPYLLEVKVTVLTPPRKLAFVVEY